MGTAHRTTLAVAAAVVLLAGCVAEPSPGGTASSAPSRAPSASASPTSSASASAPATPDPYAGFFAQKAAAEQGDHRLQFWGSFGDPGGVAVVSNRDAVLPAGSYVVQVTCAGTEGVAVTITTDPGDEPLASTTLDCSTSVTVGVTLDLVLTQPGVQYVLDSDGEPGAYLLQVRDAVG